MTYNNEWSIGFQHPTYGYPMSASLRVDEGDGAAFCDEMTYDEDYVTDENRAEVETLCARWTGRSFDSVDEMLGAFKRELGLSRSDVL